MRTARNAIQMARVSSVKATGSRLFGLASMPSSQWPRRTLWMKACPALTNLFRAQSF